MATTLQLPPLEEAFLDVLLFPAGCSTVALDAAFREGSAEGVALDAACIPSLEVLRFAAARAVFAHITGVSKARTITAEFVLSMSPIKSIGESFRRFTSKPAESAGPTLVTRIRFRATPVPEASCASSSSSSSAAAAADDIVAWASRCTALVGSDPVAATDADENLCKNAVSDTGIAAVRKAFKLSDDDLAAAGSLQEACIDVIGANE